MSPAMWLAEGVTCDVLPMFTLAILILRTGPWIFIISLRVMFQLGFPCLFSFQRCERAVSLAKIKAKAFSAVAQVRPLCSKFFPTWHLSFHLHNPYAQFKSQCQPCQPATTRPASDHWSFSSKGVFPVFVCPLGVCSLSLKFRTPLAP